jgi:hypothetical protein
MVRFPGSKTDSVNPCLIYFRRYPLESGIMLNDYLQEALVIFAANFIRRATPWLARQSQPMPQNQRIENLGVKRQVPVGAHVSAQVIHDSEGKLLKFSEHSVFAGKVLKFPGCSWPKSFG